MNPEANDWKTARWKQIFADARKQMNDGRKGKRIDCPQCRAFYGDYPSDSEEFMKSWPLMKATYTRKERSKWTKIGYYCEQCELFIPLIR